MKKFLLSLLLCSSITALPSVALLPPVIAAPGNLQLHDSPTQRGIIMDTIMNHPEFQTEAQTIKEFLNIPITQANIPYSSQQIIQKVQQSTDWQKAIAVIEAFEKALMHRYHYDLYLCGSYHPWSSMFITGIRYSWGIPTKWINPANWMSENNPIATQILLELEYLARIAHLHSYVTGKRLDCMVQSYRHWRRNLALCILAYFSADAYGRGWKNSSLNDLCKGGLSNTPVLTQKFGENIINAAAGIATGSKMAYHYGYKVVQPVVDAICYGNHNKEIEPKQFIPRRIRNWWNNTETISTSPETTNPGILKYGRDTCASYFRLIHQKLYSQDSTN